MRFAVGRQRDFNFGSDGVLHQITQLRDQLQRELIAFGELRAHVARHKAIARDAILRLDESEAREGRSLRDLGTARQRIAELQATLAQRQEKLRASVRTRRKPKPAAPKKRAGYADKILPSTAVEKTTARLS